MDERQIIMQDDIKNEKLKPVEAEALAEGLRESTQLGEQLAEAQKVYRKLDKKYPLKNKSKYTD